jgi:hypothetical protein
MKMRQTTKIALTLMAVLCLSSLGTAETILINFGGIDGSTDITGSDGSLTNYNEAVDGGTQSTVVDSDGNTLAGVTITATALGSFDGMLDNNSDTYAAEPGGSVPAWVDLDAIERTWYYRGVAAITISGLGTTPYHVDFIAARSSSGPSSTARQGSYTIGGSAADSGGTSSTASTVWNAHYDGWELGGVMTWNDVSPDAGDITIDISGESPGENVYPTAIRLTAVPEPASLSLLALGSLALLRRRRR